MKPDTSHWRDNASYDYFDDLSVEGLAWECLRRDEAYQGHYQSIVTTGTDAEPLPREVEQRWGLRFRGTAIPKRRGADRPVVAPRQSGRRASRPLSRFRA
ncbi:transcriptional regulator domain-containing protein [Xanthobacter sediminis]|uniref:transcriptional regulator domain-containing protein n=1 Tax=Xanthobacter sediminis TaxID=3119926 RepID=UPI0037291E63